MLRCVELPVYGNVLDDLIRHTVTQDDSLRRHFQGHFRQFLPSSFGLPINTTDERRFVFYILRESGAIILMFWTLLCGW